MKQKFDQIENGPHSNGKWNRSKYNTLEEGSLY